MPEAQTITDAQLLEQLQSSYIADEQKKELETLVSKMSDEERTQLLSLIEQSRAEYEKAQKGYQEGLTKLGAEYEKEVKEEDEKFRKDFEKLEQKEEVIELKEIETEMAEVKPEAQAKKTVAKGTGGVKKHTLRNLFLILVFLFLITITAIFALNYLS